MFRVWLSFWPWKAFSPRQWKAFSAVMKHKAAYLGRRNRCQAQIVCLACSVFNMLNVCLHNVSLVLWGWKAPKSFEHGPIRVHQSHSEGASPSREWETFSTFICEQFPAASILNLFFAWMKNGRQCGARCCWFDFKWSSLKCMKAHLPQPVFANNRARLSFISRHSGRDNYPPAIDSSLIDAWIAESGALVLNE